MIAKLLKIESFLILVLVLIVYHSRHLPWLWFLLILVPDISMVGYLKNAKLGAGIYNLVHTYIFPLLLLVAAIALQGRMLTIISLIWIAHISMDRMLGFGLKSPTGFKDTHLGIIGTSKK